MSTDYCGGGKAVPDYKLYLRGRDGHFTKSLDIDATSDGAACRIARELDHQYGVEIWQGARKVAVIDPTPD